VRLVQIADRYWWEIDGETALAGVDLMRLPFRRFIAAVMSWANPRGSRKEEDLREYEEWLFSPFSGVDPDRVTDDVIESEMEAFRAFAKQAGGSK